MALLDGELPAAEAKLVSTHIDECAECAGIAAQFRETSHSLAEWTVPAAPESLDAAIHEHAAKAASRRMSPAPKQPGSALRDWRLWILGGGGAVAAILFTIVAARSDLQQCRPANRPPLLDGAEPADGRSQLHGFAIHCSTDTAAIQVSLQAGVAGGCS